jgi:hypothetical protein
MHYALRLLIFSLSVCSMARSKRNEPHQHHNNGKAHWYVLDVSLLLDIVMTWCCCAESSPDLIIFVRIGFSSDSHSSLPRNARVMRNPKRMKTLLLLPSESLPVFERRVNLMLCIACPSHKLSSAPTSTSAALILPSAWSIMYRRGAGR